MLPLAGPSILSLIVNKRLASVARVVDIGASDWRKQMVLLRRVNNSLFSINHDRCLELYVAARTSMFPNCLEKY